MISKFGSNYYSDFCFDRNNAMHCVWVQFFELDSTIVFYARSDDYGRLWTTPTAVTGNLKSRFDSPHIAVDTSGNLFVTFDMDPVNNMKICYTTLMAGDTDWSQPVQLGFGLVNKVVVDNLNRVFFFWTRQGEEYRYLEDGILSDILQVYPSWPDTNCGLHDFALGEENIIQAVGNGGLGTNGYVAWFSFVNDYWEPFVPLCEKTCYESNLSLNSIWDPSFVWRQRLPSNPSIMATYFSEIVNDTACQPVLLGENTSFPDIALDYSDKPHVVESQETDTNYQLVHRYRTNAGWISRVVEENKTWYNCNNLISNNNYLFWIYDKVDTLYNDTLGVYYGNVWFRKLELPAAIEQYGSRLTRLTAFPNPFSESVTIRFDITSSCDMTIQVYSFSGNLVFFKVLRTVQGVNAVVWDAKNSSGNTLPKGIYFIRLSSETANQVVKVIRQ